jgi:hypothetical protein
VRHGPSLDRSLRCTATQRSRIVANFCIEDPPLVQNNRRTLPAAETANGDGLPPAQGHRNYSRRSGAGSTQANLERLADDCLSGKDLYQVAAALDIVLHDWLGSVFFGVFTLGLIGQARITSAGKGTKTTSRLHWLTRPRDAERERPSQSGQ